MNGRGAILCGAPTHDHKEENMGETITMAEVLYVPVDDQGEAYRWGPEGEVTVSAFGDFWSSCRSPSERARIALPLLSGLRQARLRGRWSDVTEIAYRPGADGYIKGRDEILQTAIEGVTDR